MELCFDYGELPGVKNSKTLSNKKDANSVLNNLVSTVISLMNDKQPISDDMLILCFQYCKSILKSNNSKDGTSKKFQIKKNSNVKLAQNFMVIFQKVGKECLLIESDNDEKDDSKEKEKEKENNALSIRNYQWFRQYLLFSNVWLMELQTESQLNKKSHSINSSGSKNKSIEPSNSLLSSSLKIGTMDSLTRDTSENDIVDQSLLLYDTIDSTVDIALRQQQEFIYNHVLMEEKTENKEWNDIISVNDMISNNISHLRQDCIPNGFRSEYNESQLWRIAPRVDNQNFDCFEEYNRIFLKKILLAAHAMNNSFQSNMKQLSNIHVNLYNTVSIVKYHDHLCVLLIFLHC